MNSLLLIFSLAFIFSILLYLIGLIVAPETNETIGKIAPYACGEDYPSRKIQVNAERFFIYLTFFTIFDISAFILAISLNNLGLYPAIFGMIILLATVTLFPTWREM